MDSEQRRKRRRPGQVKPGSLSPWPQLFSLRSLVLCLSFFVFLLFISSDRYLVNSGAFRPVLSSSALSVLSSSSSAAATTTSNILLDSLSNRLLTLPLRVDDRVQFPDHLLLLVASPLGIYSSEKFECVYYHQSNSTAEIGNEEFIAVRPVLSSDAYDELRSIVRCPLPPANYSAAADPHRRGDVAADHLTRPNRTVLSWDRVAYEAALDGNTVVVFVKGLNLRPHRRSDPAQFSCHFGLGNWEKDDGLILTTEAISAAQEVVRCLLPRTILANPSKANGVRVTVGVPANFHGGAGKSSVHVPMPSLAKIYTSEKDSNEEEKSNKFTKKYEICACTMLWNQAASLREWIMYHSWLGVEKWFIYDNNSDDAIKDMIDDLELENYNVSRIVWPWIKTQEAGFSHCLLKAKDECQWVGFFDVDEFFFFPFPSRGRTHNNLGVPGHGSLRALVANLSSHTSIPVAEIRTTCHSFGPSGLTTQPPQGVTAGYTCRLMQPERHKSIVQPDAIDSTLLNEVHHFRLKEGFRYLNVPESMAVINHYKYQVWETFRAKFYRRVSSYVVDWQENQNTGSKDRAPGLGTEPIEPPDWRLRFCEVWDTGLRDFVLANFADPVSMKLPWER